MIEQTSFEMFSTAGDRAVAEALRPHLEELRDQRQRGFVPMAGALGDRVWKVVEEVVNDHPEAGDTAVRETIFAALENATR